MPNARFGKEFGSGFFKTLLFSLASKNLLHLKSIMLNIHFIYEAKWGQLRTIANYIEAGEIKPVIDRVFLLKMRKSNGIFRGWKSKRKIIVKLIIIKPPFS